MTTSKAFRVGDCPTCGGFLKPSVVFFAAHAQRTPIVSINRGVTRADALLQFKVEDDCASTLARLVEAMDLCFDS